MKSTLSYFTGSIAFAIMALIGVATYGVQSGAVLSMLTSALILAVLETTVSFDNAILNAATLRHMNAFWRKLFLTLGMFIAVFVVRMALPILIVQFSGDVSFIQALTIPFTDKEQYAAIMHDAHVSILGFGLTFLLMVVLSYFFDSQKDHHWLHYVEKHMANAGQHKNVQTFIATLVIALIAAYVEPTKQIEFLVSAFIGYFTYTAMHYIKVILGGADLATAVAKNGLIGFTYLEILDASFSLDGVVAAFAITSDFVVIAAGLGIGAMFVRSMTVMLVDKGTLDAFEFLEHSAYWAIASLVVIMTLGVLHIEVGEVIAGLSSAAIIAAGVVSSNLKKG